MRTERDAVILGKPDRAIHGRGVAGVKPQATFADMITPKSASSSAMR